MNLARIVGQTIPKIIPPHWRVMNVEGYPVVWRLTSQGLKILFSIDTLKDGKAYRHISFSREREYPGWDEMRDAIYACVFFDESRDVVMVLPPAAEYVNAHPNCFHWWQEID